MRRFRSPVGSSGPGCGTNTPTIFVAYFSGKVAVAVVIINTAGSGKHAPAIQFITPASAGNAAAAATSADNRIQLIIGQILSGDLQILFRQFYALRLPEIDNLALVTSPSLLSSVIFLMISGVAANCCNLSCKSLFIRPSFLKNGFHESFSAFIKQQPNRLCNLYSQGLLERIPILT